MDEADFNALADAELEHLEGLLDACELDFDYEVKPGGVFELEFDNGTKIIVNRHSAAREIWLAAKSGGFHFRPDGGRWLGTRDGADFYAVLSRCMTEQAGESVSLQG
ncbi:iron donor protein CyaY [Zoogloea sp.]|uniref:iron donor protein CyaY n=1 Tax=Zoogloea sp. TaxID=49181 RepID=UPI0035AEC25E